MDNSIIFPIKILEIDGKRNFQILFSLNET